MQTRRHFIGNVATSLAGTLAAGGAPGAVFGANDRIRVGVIGVGDRGLQLTREVAASPAAELAAFADVYKRRLDEAQRTNAGTKTFIEYRDLLADPSIDAVIIATPQHLHAECFVGAMEAGKHVYLEKTLALTVEEAKWMRAALLHASARFGTRTVQVGHQGLSSGQINDARNYLGNLGQVTAIRGHMYRNSPHGKPQWVRPLYPDMTPESVNWSGFLGSAHVREFDADRYVNWRLYRDYSGGNVHENMSNQLAFWYRTMDLTIPAAVMMTGGIYRWKDGREVPDTITVAMEHTEELLFSWDSGFGNNEPGVREEVLGTDGTIVRSQQIRFLPQKVTRPDGIEMLGSTATPPRAHMENFFESIRSQKETNCPFEIGYRTSIACAMALRSYDEGRRVGWDSEKEEII